MKYILYFRRYAPFDTFGFGFEGNHRTSATADLHVTSKSVGCVVINGGHVGSIEGFSSGSRHTFLPILSNTLFSAVRTSLKITTVQDNTLAFTASTSAHLPALDLAHLPERFVNFMADIDTIVSIKFKWHFQNVHDDNSDLHSNYLQIWATIMGDDFPNLEIFLCDDVTNSRIIFDGRTSGDRELGAFTHLPGDHRSNVLAKFDSTLSLDSKGRFAGLNRRCKPTVMNTPLDAFSLESAARAELGPFNP